MPSNNCAIIVTLDVVALRLFEQNDKTSAAIPFANAIQHIESAHQKKESAVSEHPNRPSLVDELLEQIGHVLPQASALGSEAKMQLHGVLQQVFAKMDLLTREEFAAQQRALERAEQKIAELELIVKALEARQADDPAPTAP